MILECLNTCAVASILLFALFCILVFAYRGNARARYHLSLAAFSTLIVTPLLLVGMWCLRPTIVPTHVEVVRTVPMLLSLTRTPPSPDYSGWVLPIWAAGAALSSIPLLLGLVSLTTMARRARRAVDSRLTALFQECVHRAGVRPPLLVVGTSHWSPGTWGVRPGVVYLPASATDWSDERLESTFFHELAHLKRKDWFLTTAVWALSCLFWFNPLVWVLRGTMRTSAEFLCDEEVVRVGVSPTSYAEHLLLLVKAVSRPTSLRPAGAMLAGYSLETRVAAVLGGKARSRGTALPLALGLIVALGVSATLARSFVRTESRKDTIRNLEKQLQVRVGQVPMVLFTERELASGQVKVIPATEGALKILSQ